jgi:hypothetical protein
MHSMLINIKTILNVSIRLASYKINCIVLLILGLCSSGSIHSSKDINVKNKITVNICMLQNTGITILWWTHPYCGGVSVTAQQRLSVYRSVWLCRLECRRGWVRISFVLQSVIHVAVMYACKTISNSSLIFSYCMLIIIVLCIPGYHIQACY